MTFLVGRGIAPHTVRRSLPRRRCKIGMSCFGYYASGDIYIVMSEGEGLEEYMIQTLSHELVHAMTEARLKAPRPLFVSEGIAEAVSLAVAQELSSTLACPTVTKSDDLWRSVTPARDVSEGSNCSRRNSHTAHFLALPALAMDESSHCVAESVRCSLTLPFEAKDRGAPK